MRTDRGDGGAGLQAAADCETPGERPRREWRGAESWQGPDRGAGGGAGPRAVGSQETRPQAPKPSQAGGGPSSLPEPHRSRLRSRLPPWCSHPPAWETGPRSDRGQMPKRSRVGRSACAASETRAQSRNQGSSRREGVTSRTAEQRRRTATTRERQAETSSSVPREERRESVDRGDLPEKA